MQRRLTSLGVLACIGDAQSSLPVRSSMPCAAQGFQHPPYAVRWPTEDIAAARGTEEPFEYSRSIPILRWRRHVARDTTGINLVYLFRRHEVARVCLVHLLPHEYIEEVRIDVPVQLELP